MRSYADQNDHLAALGAASRATVASGADSSCAASGKGYTTIVLGTGANAGKLIVTTQYDNDATDDVMTNEVEAE